MRKFDDDDDEEEERPLRRRYLRRRYLDEDEDEEERGPEYDPEEELEQILQRLDRFRRQFALEFRLLHSLLTHHPDLRAQYESFLRSGGISHEDFERFLDGDMRPRLTPRRGHLRLVSNTRSRLLHRLRIRRSSDEPDDAA
jgi:hypothetical protein